MLVLNVETFIPSIDLQPQNLNPFIAVRINFSFFNKLYLESGSGNPCCKFSSLERVEEKYENQAKSVCPKNDRIYLFTISLWWILPYISINPCKNSAKMEHEKYSKTFYITDIYFYTDRSGINNKISVLAYLLGLEQILKLYFGSYNYYTIYIKGLIRILIAL